MSRWRWLVLGLCFAGPLLVLAVIGGVWLWHQPWGKWVSWLLFGLFALGYLLAWYWQRQRLLLPHLEPTQLPAYWQTADRQAWDVVRRYARLAEQTSPDELKALQWYYETGKRLALEVARVYHPEAADPVAFLRVPEILAAIELAAHDLYRLVVHYVPGSHLLTVQHWRRAADAVEWYGRLSNIYWGISALLSPMQTAARYLASRVGLAPLQQQLLRQVLGWFAQAYVYRLGWYLVELNSGRLQLGADRYRQAFVQGQIPTPWSWEPASGVPATGEQASAQPRRAPVRVVVVGQAGSGKSALVKALLGEQLAAAQVVSPRPGFTEYRLEPGRDAADTAAKSHALPGPAEEATLILVDTPGYGQAEKQEETVEAIFEQARQAQTVLLVISARHTDYQPDRDWLEAFRQHLQKKAPNQALPLILGVLTDLDKLPPVEEWQPPYQWRQPTRAKERNIAEAVEAVRRALQLETVVPVGIAREPWWGLDELSAAILDHLDQAQALASFSALTEESKKEKWSQLWRQTGSLVRQAWRVLWRRKN